MITYRDMTFCGFYRKCLTPCDRSLTKEVLASAKAERLPLCQFLEKPECFIDKRTSVSQIK